MLMMKTMTAVLNVLTYVITSITACFIGDAVILVIISVSAFITTLILYVLMYCSFPLFAFHSHLFRCFDMFYKYLRFSYIFMVDVAGATFVINIVWLVYGV